MRKTDKKASLDRRSKPLGFLYTGLSSPCLTQKNGVSQNITSILVFLRPSLAVRRPQLTQAHLAGLTHSIYKSL